MSFVRLNNSTQSQLPGSASLSTSAAAGAAASANPDGYDSHDENGIQKKRPSEFLKKKKITNVARCNASWVWKHTSKIKKVNKRGNFLKLTYGPMGGSIIF